MTSTGSFLDGKWFLPKSDRKTRNTNPADTHDVLAEFPSATGDDTHRAIDVAIKAFPAWKKTPPPERGRVLWRAAEIARRRAEEIARTMTREEGKILKEARGETTKGINVMEFFAGEGFRLEGRTTPAESRDCFTYTVLVTLEDYGFAKKGEGGALVEKGNLGPGGKLPTNTGGGELSSYYMWGMTPLSEAVIQTRGQGGERQVPKHDLVIVSTQGGALDTHSTLILSPHPAQK